MANLSLRAHGSVFSLRPCSVFIALTYVLLNILGVSAISSVQSRVSPDDTPLVPGPGFNEELKGGHADTYKVSVPAGHYLRVVIEQHGIIIVATLTNQQGNEVVKADNPSGGYGPIYVSTISQSSGDYRLEVRSTETWANPGRYKISIEELRQATPIAGERVAAEKNYNDGRQLSEQRKYKEALAKFEAALSYWQRVRDRHWIALTEFSLAVTHRSLGDRQAASQHFDKSLAVEVDEDRDWRLRASVFNDRGINLGRLGKPQEALDSVNEALRIYRSHNDRRGWASALNNIGTQELRRARYREAIDNFERALPLRRAENDKNGEAVLFNNIASAQNFLGNPSAALEGYIKALRIWEELKKQGQLQNWVTTLGAGFNNVALAYDRLGQWQEALETYEKALAIFAGAAPIDAAKTLDNIGELYVVLGDLRKASEYYRKARASVERKDPDAEANILSHIGQLYVLEGKLPEALAHFELALSLRKDDPGKANELTNIGAVYALQSSPRKALESYASALKLVEGSENRRGLAFTLQKIGEAHVLLREPVKAIEFLNRALPIWRALADQRREAATLHAVAVAEGQRGNLTEALERSKQSLNLIESLRTKVASQRLRSSFFASQQSQYELYIDLRMRLYELDQSAEHLDATLEASEQSRARSLVDILTEARANIHSGISKDLVKREREAQVRLNDKARVQMELLNRKHSKEEAASVESEINQAIAEYDAVKATIRASNPDYAQLTQPQSLSVGEIQQLLDDETLLLEYFLGEEKSYLWLVSRGSKIEVARLPKRSEIESAALAFYKSLTQRTLVPNGKALSQMLLGPVADRLGTKRLVIVGDGVLQYLPFAALPSPSPQGTRSTRATTPYLIEQHEIVYLPSASVLSVLRTETDDRKPAPLSVAVLAYPVFSANDERVKASPSRVNPDGDKVLSGELELVPLVATEKEADAILEAMPSPGKKKIFKDFEASRATVMKLQTEGYRIVHFATHGYLDAEHPELSSIILSLVDSDGRRLLDSNGRDGFLQLHDIYNLKLPAELVVLSACRTGLGRIIKGEGLIGLTRGFMYAGSPRVVASLWQVEDLSTSELMKRFYWNMGRKGMSPPLALRQAQVDLLRGRRWRLPYHWAGFVIQGEWRAIH